MNYDETVFKEKANRRARKIWLVFAILLSANYGSDTSNGLHSATYYLTFWLYAGFPSLPVRSCFVSKAGQPSVTNTIS